MKGVVAVAPRLEVRAHPLRGRGVHARGTYVPGELIERAPVIVLDSSAMACIDTTRLYDYYFEWSDRGEIAIALGYLSLVNHSYKPNARYVKNEAALAIDLVAYRAIGAGEEITINYNGDPKDRTPVWFEVLS